MISIEFHLRASRRKGGGEGKVNVRVIHNRKGGSLTLPYSLWPEEWDASLRKPVVPEGSSRTRGLYVKKVAALLEQERQVFHGIVRELEAEGLFTVRNVFSRYKVKQSPQSMAGLVSHLSAELDTSGKFRTARAYRTAWNRLVGYTGVETLAGEQFNAQLVTGFEQYLRDEKMSLNTISFYMRNLRAIYNKGVKLGYFEKKEVCPFAGTYTKVAPTPKRSLTPEEMSTLENLLAKPDSLAGEEKESLRLFMFAFHACGMCFVDLAHLKREDINGGRVSYYRKKTGQYIRVKVTENMKAYMKTLPKNESGFLFPVIRDEKDSYRQYCNGLKRQNQLLKRIGKKAGIKKPLTTHMARHSWATIAKKEDISIWAISELLGHTSLETTNRYLDSFGQSALDKACAKVSKAVSPGKTKGKR